MGESPIGAKQKESLMTRKVVVEYTILPMASVYANSEDLIVAISEETKTAKTKRSAFRKARAAGGAHRSRPEAGHGDR